MAGKFNVLVTVGLVLFTAGLILPFIDLLIIKSLGKAAESIGAYLLFISLFVFAAGVILTLFGFHRKNKQFYMQYKNK